MICSSFWDNCKENSVFNYWRRDLIVSRSSEVTHQPNEAIGHMKEMQHRPRDISTPSQRYINTVPEIYQHRPRDISTPSQRYIYIKLNKMPKCMYFKGNNYETPRWKLSTKMAGWNIWQRSQTFGPLVTTRHVNKTTCSVANWSRFRAMLGVVFPKTTFPCLASLMSNILMESSATPASRTSTRNADDCRDHITGQGRFKNCGKSRRRYPRELIRSEATLYNMIYGAGI